jgi:D-xylose transport system ATP-binding protein
MTTATDAQQPVLEVVGATKRFGAVRALNGASLELYRGEVLALLGDNGAGKSTLIKSISGHHHLDEGEIRVDGESVVVRSPAVARELGIETVYQDLALFDNLSASQNFFVGRELRWPRWLGPFGLLRERAMRTETDELVERLKVNLPDPGALVGVMSGGQRQAIACARAVAFASKIVILDEPTAALGLREAGKVLDLIRMLRSQGVAVILISHNMEQVLKVADRAVVLRRGAIVGSAVPTEETQQLLVSLIMGATAGEG